MAQRYDMAGRKWSLAEDDQLWDEYQNSKTMKEMSTIHKRTERAIECRIFKLHRERIERTEIPVSQSMPLPVSYHQVHHQVHQSQHQIHQSMPQLVKPSYPQLVKPSSEIKSTISEPLVFNYKPISDQLKNASNQNQSQNQNETEDESTEDEDGDIYDLYLHLIDSKVSLTEICDQFWWFPKQIDHVLYDYILKNPNSRLAKQKLYDSLVGLNQKPTNNKGECKDDKWECKICMDNQMSVVFQCGHWTCEKCADQISNCHQCRAKIISKIKIYTD